MLDYKTIYQKEHVENGLTYSQIREKYNIPRGTWDYYIRVKLHLSSDCRKYRVNDDFFTTINSEIKAYLLGFLYADGYLTSDGRIGCRLTQDDIEIIYLMQEYIAPNSPIQYSNNQNFKRKPQVSIRWRSKQMYQDLLNLGFCVDKTHINSNIFANIPEEYKLAFIRGYCDGDGSIIFRSCAKTSYKCGVVFCNGCSQILEDIQLYLSKYNCTGVLRPIKNWYRLEYDKVKDAFTISSLLYNNARFYLSRKFQKAQNMINYRTNTELTGNFKRFPVV